MYLLLFLAKYRYFTINNHTVKTFNKGGGGCLRAYAGKSKS